MGSSGLGNMNSILHSNIIILCDMAELASEGARQFVQLAREAIAERGRFSVALSGGSTPRATHELLARPPLTNQVDWPNVHVFWGDERFVSPDHPDSNQLMARQTLLDHVPISAENIHPVPTTGMTPEQAAQRYAEILTAFSIPGAPLFDLVFLGLGPDGHTASLFPGHPEVQATGDALVVVARGAPKPPPVRITLTLKAINEAANVIFLVAGADKAKAVKTAMRNKLDLNRCPAQGVRPVAGKVLWLLDREAAGAISKE